MIYVFKIIVCYTHIHFILKNVLDSICKSFYEIKSYFLILECIIHNLYFTSKLCNLNVFFTSTLCNSEVNGLGNQKAFLHSIYAIKKLSFT